jgi:uncharacterized metal-binding protein
VLAPARRWRESAITGVAVAQPRNAIQLSKKQSWLRFRDGAGSTITAAKREDHLDTVGQGEVKVATHHAGENPNKPKTLIYSCSGCSNLAQTANDIALRLHRNGLAEMSCIAGVGGNVKSLVKIASSGRPIVAIDGCHLHCVKSCLQHHDIAPDVHYTLTELGARKRMKSDYDAADFEHFYQMVLADI